MEVCETSKMKIRTDRLRSRALRMMQVAFYKSIRTFLEIGCEKGHSLIFALTLCSLDVEQVVPSRYTRWLSSPRSLLDDTCTCYVQTRVEFLFFCQPRSRTARHPPLKRNTPPIGQHRSSDRIWNVNGKSMWNCLSRFLLAKLGQVTLFAVLITEFNGISLTDHNDVNSFASLCRDYSYLRIISNTNDETNITRWSIYQIREYLHPDSILANYRGKYCENVMEDVWMAYYWSYLLYSFLYFVLFFFSHFTYFPDEKKKIDDVLFFKLIEGVDLINCNWQGKYIPRTTVEGKLFEI